LLAVGLAAGCGDAKACSGAPAPPAKDRYPPGVLPSPFGGYAVRPSRLTYRVLDDTGHSCVQLSVEQDGKRIASLDVGWKTNGVWDWFWQSPGAGSYRFCIVATDPAGKRSSRECAPFRVYPH